MRIHRVPARVEFVAERAHDRLDGVADATFLVTRIVAKRYPLWLPNVLRRFPLGVMVVAAALAVSGCASRVMKPERVTEPARLRIASDAPDALHLAVKAAIAPGDPGSWVRDAPWQEYRLEFTNAGTRPVTIQSIVLSSDLPEPSPHTTSLEALSSGTADTMQFLKATGSAAVAGLGTAGIAGVAGLSAWASGSTVAATVAASAMLPLAVLGAGTVYAADAWQRQEDSRLMQEQLSGRGLSLPVTVPPAGFVAASAFFPLAPNPGRIVARYGADGESREVAVAVSAATMVAARARESPAVTASGPRCRLSRVIDDPDPLPDRPPLLVAGDGRISVILEAVIARNGPGSWASDADWDEYRLRVRSRDALPRTVVQVSVDDALDRHFEAGHSPCGPPAPATAAVSRPDAVPVMDLLSVPLPASGAVLAVAAVAAAGSEQARFAMSAEIERRQSRLPIRLEGGRDVALVHFFPSAWSAPLPVRLSVDYEDGEGRHRLDIDTRAALAHLRDAAPPLRVRRPPMTWPVEGVPYHSPRGFVKARLALDPSGRVTEVEFLDSSPGDHYRRAAMRLFAKWRYVEGAGVRKAEARLDFAGAPD